MGWSIFVDHIRLTHFDVVARLCAATFPTYIVGGAVRDLFDGIDAQDVDIVTQATPQQIEELFPDCEVKTVGRSFGVVLVDGFEVATFRHDRYEVLGAKNCIVTYANTIHEDLSRRDLTVNALALCELTGELVDDFQGMEDLKNRTIRFVGDPYQRIQEDPNRILRAARFLAKLEGVFDPATLIALRRSAHLVATAVAKERIYGEIMKAMKLHHPSLFWGALHLIGALPYILPELGDAVDHCHGKWHQEDIWTHMMIAGDWVSPKYPLVRLAAFLHDIGKPASFQQNSEGTFHDHDIIGADILYDRLSDLKFPHEQRDTIVNLVRTHMLGHFNDGTTPKSLRRLRKNLLDHGVNGKDWLRVRIADHAASIRKEPFTLREIRNRLGYLGFAPSDTEPSAISVKDLAIGGGELMEALGLSPGPIVGQLQKALLEYVIDHGNPVNHRDELLKVARGLLP